MTALQKLHAIEESKVIWDIHYCNAGIGIVFAVYEPPYPNAPRDRYSTEERPVWRTVENYYPTFEKAVDAEYKRLVGPAKPRKGAGK